MANTIDWGKASVNNTNGYGKGAIDNTIRWGKIYESSASGDTNIGTATTPSFSNTKSVRFDGIDDYVTMGNQSSLDFEQTDAFSISAWVNRNSIGNRHVIVSKQQFSFGINSPGYNLQINNNDKVTFLLVFKFATHRFIQIESTNTITDSNWHHIVLTYDGTGGSSAANGVEIYIDGLKETVSRSGNLGASGATTLNSGDFSIGSFDEQSNYMDGAIDEVSVFNTELSQSQVTEIYNSGVPNDISSLSPLSWWRCGDSDTFPILTDNGSGGNDGTMTNMTSGNIVTDVPT